MTPERWRRIDDLFEPRFGIDPAGREAWLREACGGDDGPAGRGRPAPGPGRAGGPGRVPDAPRGDRPASGSDGELAPPCHSPPCRDDPGRTPLARIDRPTTTGLAASPPRPAIAPRSARQPISEPRSSCGPGCASCR